MSGLYQGVCNQSMSHGSWAGHLLGFGDPDFKVPMVGWERGYIVSTIHSHTDEPTSALSVNTKTLNKQTDSSMIIVHIVASARRTMPSNFVASKAGKVTFQGRKWSEPWPFMNLGISRM